MFDFSVRLGEDPHLLSLLSHYARLGSDDRAAWQDRLMQMEGVAPGELTALHGELIALDGIEQNTGRAVLRPDGGLSSCYRVTPCGLREFRRAHGAEAGGEQPEAMEEPQPKLPRKRKGRGEVHAAGSPE